MSSHIAVEPTKQLRPRAYRVTIDPITSCGYIYLSEEQPEGLGGLDQEVCAGGDGSGGSVIADRFRSSDKLRGIEIISSLVINDSRPRWPRSQFRPVEFIVGRHEGPIETIVDGFDFDGCDRGSLPGLEVDYTDSGELIAIRVLRARCPSPVTVFDLIRRTRG